MTSEFGSFVSPCFVIIGFINVIFTVVNVVYQLLYFVERPLARGCETPSRCEDVFLACGAFPLGRGENKITGIILTLMNVQICLHRYTLSRSFHPFPPLCDLLLMVHKDNTQLGKF